MAFCGSAARITDRPLYKAPYVNCYNLENTFVRNSLQVCAAFKSSLLNTVSQKGRLRAGKAEIVSLKIDRCVQTEKSFEMKPFYSS